MGRTPKNSSTVYPLLSRASTRDLADPAPSEEQLLRILSASLRAPDHGGLMPWRYVIVRGKQRAMFAELVTAARLRLEPDIEPKKLDKQRLRICNSPVTLILAMRIHKPHKIPLREQEMAVAAGAMNVLNALHFEGFSGFWVSESVSTDTIFRQTLGFLSKHALVGFMYVGTPREDARFRTKRPDIRDYSATWDGGPVSFGADR